MSDEYNLTTLAAPTFALSIFKTKVTMNLKDIVYAFACLAFSVVIGGAIYEHLCVVPQWAAAPPHSLSMFQGKYGLYPQAFWIPIHPITFLLIVTTLVFAWKTPRRNNVLTTLLGYVTILIITSIYFVPELIAITETPYSTEISTTLTARAKQWEMLSIVRLFTLIILAVVLLLGLAKAGSKKSN